MNKIIISTIIVATLVAVSVGASVSNEKTDTKDKSNILQETKISEVETMTIQEEIEPIEPVVVSNHEAANPSIIQPIETTDEKFERLIMTTYAEYNQYGMSGIAYTLKDKNPDQYSIDTMEKSLADLYADYDEFIANGGNYSLFMRKVLQERS